MSNVNNNVKHPIKNMVYIPELNAEDNVLLEQSLFSYPELKALVDIYLSSDNPEVIQELRSVLSSIRIAQFNEQKYSRDN